MPDQKEIMAYDGRRTCITQYEYPLQNLIFLWNSLGSEFNRELFIL